MNIADIQDFLTPFLRGPLFVGFFLSLTISLIVVPIIRKVAISKGQFDHPGERKIHKTPIPRLGGIAIWLAFVLTFALLALFYPNLPSEEGVAGILIGSGIIFYLGLVDDLFNISPYVKLVGQTVAAIAAFYLGVEVANLDLPGSQILVLHGLSLPFTLFWLVGLSNAMNFIDGVDGLAGGVTTISAITLCVIAVFTHQPIAALMAALLAGGTLGFLIYNFYPARIFMGDSGALFIGFTLASIAVTGVLKSKVVVMLLPMLILSVPILDISYAVFRRLSQGKNPFIADAEHIHHKLIGAGFSQKKIVACFYVVSIIAGMVATGYVNYLKAYLFMILGIVLLAIVLGIVVRRVVMPVAPNGA